MTTPLPFDIRNIELMTVRDVQGLLKLSYLGAIRLIRKLPPNAIVRSSSGRGRRILIHSWALAKILGFDSCPGCGRPWEDNGPSTP